MRLFIWLAAGLLAAPLSAQTTWYVSASYCPGPGSGQPWDPFCELSTAVATARSGDTILVAPGTYSQPIFSLPVVDFQGKDLTIRSTHGPSQTTLQNGDPGVLFSGGESRNATLEGFTISASQTGIEVVAASPTIRGNRIRNNSTIEGGGGLRITGGGAPLVVENEIAFNASFPTSGDGAGVWISGADAVLVRNEITDNNGFADYGTCFGAGLYAKDSTLSLIGNLFTRNRGTDEQLNRGGGVYAEDSSVSCVGNTFLENLAADGDPSPFGNPGSGGGMFLDNCQTTIVDTILWGNLATAGPEIATQGGSVSISWSDLAGGLAEVFGTGAVSAGTGVLDSNPLLVDYRLQPGSPLIDMGSPSAAGADVVDADLEPRVLDGDLDGTQRIDIGWDEYDLTELRSRGRQTPGATLTFEVAGPAGWPYLVGVSSGTSEVVQAPFGTLLLDPASLRIFGSGFVPGTHSVYVPADPGLLGVDFWTQALAKAPGARIGSYSARVRIALR